MQWSPTSTSGKPARLSVAICLLPTATRRGLRGPSSITRRCKGVWEGFFSCSLNFLQLRKLCCSYGFLPPRLSPRRLLEQNWFSMVSRNKMGYNTENICAVGSYRGLIGWECIVRTGWYGFWHGLKATCRVRSIPITRLQDRL